MKPAPDAALEWMKSHDMPLPVENYLHLTYFGQPPALDAELLASLPKELARTPEPSAQHGGLRVRVLHDPTETE